MKATSLFLSLSLRADTIQNTQWRQTGSERDDTSSLSHLMTITSHSPVPSNETQQHRIKSQSPDLTPPTQTTIHILSYCTLEYKNITVSGCVGTEPVGSGINECKITKIKPTSIQFNTENVCVSSDLGFWCRLQITETVSQTLGAQTELPVFFLYTRHTLQHHLIILWNTQTNVLNITQWFQYSRFSNQTTVAMFDANT